MKGTRTHLQGTVRLRRWGAKKPGLVIQEMKWWTSEIRFRTFLAFLLLFWGVAPLSLGRKKGALTWSAPSLPAAEEQPDRAVPGAPSPGAQGGLQRGWRLCLDSAFRGGGLCTHRTPSGCGKSFKRLSSFSNSTNTKPWTTFSPPKAVQQASPSWHESRRADWHESYLPWDSRQRVSSAAVRREEPTRYHLGT